MPVLSDHIHFRSMCNLNNIALFIIRGRYIICRLWSLLAFASSLGTTHWLAKAYEQRQQDIRGFTSRTCSIRTPLSLGGSLRWRLRWHVQSRHSECRGSCGERKVCRGDHLKYLLIQATIGERINCIVYHQDGCCVGG